MVPGIRPQLRILSSHLSARGIPLHALPLLPDGRRRRPCRRCAPLLAAAAETRLVGQRCGRPRPAGIGCPRTTACSASCRGAAATTSAKRGEVGGCEGRAARLQGRGKRRRMVKKTRLAVLGWQQRAAHAAMPSLLLHPTCCGGLPYAAAAACCPSSSASRLHSVCSVASRLPPCSSNSWRSASEDQSGNSSASTSRKAASAAGPPATRSLAAAASAAAPAAVGLQPPPAPSAGHLPACCQVPAAALPARPQLSPWLPPLVLLPLPSCSDSRLASNELACLAAGLNSAAAKLRPLPPPECCPGAVGWAAAGDAAPASSCVDAT